MFLLRNERKAKREGGTQVGRDGEREIRKCLKWWLAVERNFSHFPHEDCVYMRPEWVI